MSASRRASLLTAIRRWAPMGLAVVFVGSGTLHLVRPAVYLPLIPRGLPAPESIIVVSGIAEILCAVRLFRRARWAGPASAALLVAIFPGNISYAIDALGDPTSSSLRVIGAWLRLPLQAPLIWAALQSGRPADDRR